MGYELQAVVGRDETIRALATGVQASTVVALTSELSMLPLTAELLDALPAPSGGVAAVLRLPPGAAHWLAAGSHRGLLAYLEAEYFGGVGTQSAAVWKEGTILEKSAAADAINGALRLLGVSADPDKDEFDTVGLGRHRHTEDWIPGR
jgi:hypothetical protein